MQVSLGVEVRVSASIVQRMHETSAGEVLQRFHTQLSERWTPNREHNHQSRVRVKTSDEQDGI